LNIYSKKQRWKFALATVAAIIVFVSLWYTNILVSQVAEEEKSKVRSWAKAIQRKAELVNYTQELFKKISAEERKKVEIWAEANRGVTSAPDEALEIYTKILFNNNTIPMILTDQDGVIITHSNLDSSKAQNPRFIRKRLNEMKQKHPPVFLLLHQDWF
jgi:apolipoprotein N-acyltransferase